MAYNASAAVKTRLGITVATHDSFITTLLDVAYAFITEQIGYSFPGVTETRKFDWPGRGVVDLYTGYIHTITAVTNGDGESLTEDTHYILRYDNTLRLLVSGGKMWRYVQDKEEAISVAATFGLPTSHNLYDIVVELELGIAQWLYRSRDSAVPSQVSFTTSSAIVLAPAALPIHLKEWLSMLKPVLV